LDKGFNNTALSRDILMHGASYGSEYYAKNWHRVGRSWGCFAVPKPKVHSIINTIKGGNLIFAYAPAKKWQKDSVFLHTAIQST
jgi:hypothetical protein